MSQGRPRVGVTRDVSQAPALAAELERRDLEPVLAPLVAIAEDPLFHDAFRSALSSCDPMSFVICTSANAARLCVLHALVGQLHQLRIAAVGAATAQVFERLMIDVTVVGSQGAAALVNELQPFGPTKAIFVRAEDALSTVSNMLGDLGWTVNDLVAYRTQRCGGEDELGVLSACDAITFASPSAVSSYVHLAKSHSVNHHPRLVAIGPTTAHAIEEADLVCAAVAASPSVADLALAAKTILLC